MLGRPKWIQFGPSNHSSTLETPENTVKDLIKSNPFTIVRLSSLFVRSFWICVLLKFLGFPSLSPKSLAFHRVADLRAPLSLPKIHLGGADSRDVIDKFIDFY